VQKSRKEGRAIGERRGHLLVTEEEVRDKGGKRSKSKGKVSRGEGRAKGERRRERRGEQTARGEGQVRGEEVREKSRGGDGPIN
jgi:hypothetical protein